MVALFGLLYRITLSFCLDNAIALEIFVGIEERIASVLLVFVLKQAMRLLEPGALADDGIAYLIINLIWTAAFYGRDKANFKSSPWPTTKPLQDCLNNADIGLVVFREQEIVLTNKMAFSILDPPNNSEAAFKERLMNEILSLDPTKHYDTWTSLKPAAESPLNSREDLVHDPIEFIRIYSEFRS